MFEVSLFEEETIDEGEKVLKLFTDEKMKTWCDLLAELSYETKQQENLGPYQTT